MQHLIDITDLKIAGRPIGNIADVKLDAFLTETEFNIVLPALGNTLFSTLVQTQRPYTDAKLKMLMDGGIYTDRNGSPTPFIGLNKTIAYYVYAKNVQSGDYQSTRFGMVLKDGEHSSHISQKERSNTYNEIYGIANGYLSSVVAYAIDQGLINKNDNRKGIASTGITIRKIG